MSFRAYRSRAMDRIMFEGSFELNPYFQADIDSLRWVSPRFILALLGSSLLLLLMWWLTHQPPMWPAAYQFVLGALVLVELAVHMRHFRNIYLFSTAFGPDGVQGKIQYPRTLMLRLSAFEFLEFAGLYLVLFLATGSWFVLGGAFTCLGLVHNNRSQAKKYRKAPANWNITARLSMP